MTIRLVAGLSPKDALSAFDGAAQDLENRRNFTPDATQLRNVYLQWVDVQYDMMRQYLGLSHTDEILHSPFYWYVLTMNTADVRAAGQLHTGMTREALVVRELASQLREMATVLATPEGWHNVVVDTNALVLVKPPWDVDWAAMLGEERIRLLIPLRVIEELDKYKYDERDKRISKTARSLLPQLEQRLTADNGTKITVNAKLTIEVLIVPGERVRALHADEEILQLCEAIRQFGNEPVTVVTDDMSMRIQARARKLKAIGIENTYRRSTTTSPAVVELAADSIHRREIDTVRLTGPATTDVRKTTRRRV